MLYELVYTPKNTSDRYSIVYGNMIIGREPRKMRITLNQEPTIVLPYLQSCITYKRIKGAFPRLTDGQVWDELVNVARNFTDGHDAESAMRRHTMQFIGCVILYRHYGTMFMLYDEESDNDRDSDRDNE